MFNTCDRSLITWISSAHHFRHSFCDVVSIADFLFATLNRMKKRFMWFSFLYCINFIGKSAEKATSFHDIQFWFPFTCFGLLFCLCWHSSCIVIACIVTPSWMKFDLRLHEFRLLSDAIEAYFGYIDFDWVIQRTINFWSWNVPFECL